MALYPDEFKQYLKDTIPVQDVIAHLTGKVVQNGRHLNAVCPFHDDSDPSIMINTNQNTWSCLACGAGNKHHSVARSSDVYGFIMGFYRINLGQAIEWLANAYNIPLPEIDPQQAERKNQHKWWTEKNEMTNTRFMNNLRKNEKAYWYLYNRGIDEYLMDLFELGVGDDEDVEHKNTKGKISFPIRDYVGGIVSFVGRVPFGTTALDELNEKQKAEGKRITPKYDHRWELKPDQVDKAYYDSHPYKTFLKGEHLYGLYQAKDMIRRTGVAILVEGFLDVAKCFKHGVMNACSPMGTSITKEQCLLLKRAGARKVILMDDGDKAGLASMERKAKELRLHGIEVEVCPMPDGHDPDSYADSFSMITDGFARWIRFSTKKLSEWRVEVVYRRELGDILHHYHEIHDIQERRIHEVANVLREEQDVVQRDILIRQYAGLFNVSVETLKGMM